MLATDHTVAEFSLPQFDARALVRRAAPAALIGACAVAVVLLAGGHVHGFLDAIHRVLDVSPGWVVAGGDPGSSEPRPVARQPQRPSNAPIANINMSPRILSPRHKPRSRKVLINNLCAAAKNAPL